MTTQRTPSRADAVVTALVGAGLLEDTRREEAERVVAGALSAGEAPATPLRRRMSEIAGYVGAAFVVGAAVLFFANQWDNLSEAGRLGLLGGIAVLLGAAAGGVVMTGGGRVAIRTARQDVRRRLASVLSLGAALAAGFAVGIAVDDPSRWTDDSRAMLVGSLTALAVALGGYLLAPSVVGQVGMAATTFFAVPAALDTGGDVDPTWFGLIMLTIGLAWLVLAELGVWREDLSARVIGSGLALFGAQVPVFGDPTWVGYVLTAVLAAAAFTVYVVRPAWPYLALGVVAATLAVPEALNDWAEGSLGAAGVLLATGVTLLLASLAGLRLRHEVGEQQPRHP